MKTRSLSAIVLAAGKGVRMKSRRPKVLFSLSGKGLLDTVIDNLLEIKKLGDIIVVLSKDLLFLKPRLLAKNKRISIAIQARPRGTADAVKVGETKISRKTTDVFIIGADIALTRRQTLETFIKSHLVSNRAVSLISAFSDSPCGYGRIIRTKAGQVKRIREEIDLSDEEKHIAEINSGIYCFRHKSLRQALKLIKLRKNKNEYYLTDAVEILSSGGVEASAVASVEEVMGINSGQDLAKAGKILNSRIIGGFLSKGIKIFDPSTTYIEKDVKIGEDTTIYPFTYIEKDVKIGKNCSIGPFARLRRGVRLGDNVTVGNFVELSRSSLGRNTIVKHFSYLGDCGVGKKVNIGAGTVTANYDGRHKYKSYIADGAFIGCDTVLIAPVKVGKAAITGAGSVLVKRKNIPGGKIALGVPARIKARKNSRENHG